MPSAHSTSFLIRATPLTFALLWSSGFIVAKYAAPYADPFTFLSAARFGLAALDPGADRARQRRAMADERARDRA